MIILAIDTTMGGCSACLYDDANGVVIGSKTIEMARGQAEHLMPLIHDLVSDYKDIDLIAVTKGAGAFTGIRIGLATAKSLGLALDIPVIGVSTFEAVLQTYMNIKEAKSYPCYGILLETKRQDYYFQMFGGKISSEPSSANLQDITNMIKGKKCIIIGDATHRFKSELALNSYDNISFYDIKMPSPVEIARIAALEYKKGNSFADCSPIYLRMPEIGVPKNAPRKLKQK